MLPLLRQLQFCVVSRLFPWTTIWAYRHYLENAIQVSNLCFYLLVASAGTSEVRPFCNLPIDVVDCQPQRILIHLPLKLFKTPMDSTAQPS